MDKNAHPDKTFADGFIDGWQAATGLHTVPAIPAHAIRAGYSDYGWGYAEGYRIGKERREDR